MLIHSGRSYTGACVVLLYGHDIQHMDELHELTSVAGRLGLKVSLSRIDIKPDAAPDSATDLTGATVDHTADA